MIYIKKKKMYVILCIYKLVYKILKKQTMDYFFQEKE